jgi:trehalose-6-phosphate synthase
MNVPRTSKGTSIAAGPAPYTLKHFRCFDRAPEALLVNPYDPDSVAAAIRQALSMPLAERRERHDSLFRVLSHNDIQHWADRFLTALERAPMPLSRLEQMSSVGS